MRTCTSCELNLHHCHGLLVEHADGTATCFDGCGGPRLVHDEVVRCADLGGHGGCCEAMPAPERARLPQPAELVPAA